MHHSLSNKRSGLRLLALFCCALLVLGGCAPASLVSDTQTDTLAVPQVRHMEHAADINAALDAQFTPLVQVLQALRDSGVTLSLSYTLTQQEDVYRLDASVSAPGMNVLALSAYTLRPADGTAACADPAQQALWGDAALWRDLLVLRGAGIPVDFAACTQPLSTRQAAAWLINAYEQQAGHAVDDAGILPSVTDPVLPMPRN